MATRDTRTPYTPTYRASELHTLAGWVAAGASGSVVGLVGCGRSNFLRFACEHPDALQGHLAPDSPPTVLVPVDLYDLPSAHLADLYRTILHAFYWVRARLAPPLAQIVADLYAEHRTATDPFLAQTALYELLLEFQQAQVRVVLVMNRFDRFYETSTPQMVNMLRSLRDRFRETLSYIVGMREEVAYLADPALLGDMYELFAGHICYVGAMAEADSRHLLANLLRSAAMAPSAAELAAMLRLSGGFPSLLKAIGQWWLLAPARAPEPSDWLATLLDDAAIVYRLERLWQGLTQEEQLALSEIQKHSTFGRPHRAQGELATALGGQPGIGDAENAPLVSSLAVVQRLAAKGCCIRSGSGWRVNGDLLAAFVAAQVGRVRGQLWIDEPGRLIFQGQQPIAELTPLEFNILRFLITYPRTRHTSDAIIENAWPEDENKTTITPNNLQVHISSIRKKIEPNPATPHFLITWHGRPGGYQLFPEGKPE